MSSPPSFLRAGLKRLKVLTPLVVSCRVRTNRSGVKFQQAWRILSLVQIRMSSLQKLAQEHTLPALSLTPLPSEALPKELRDRQRAVPGVESNEGLFRMFSESMETRQNVSRRRIRTHLSFYIMTAYRANPIPDCSAASCGSRAARTVSSWSRRRSRRN